MSDDKELPVFVTECEEENAKLKERIAELEGKLKTVNDNYGELLDLSVKCSKAMEYLDGMPERGCGKRFSEDLAINVQEYIKALEANNERLRDALAGLLFAIHFNRPDEEHPMETMEPRARKALEETPADSLAAVRREAMEKMRMKMLKILTDNGTLSDDGSIYRLLCEVDIDD